ncbi:transmembrane protein 17A [Arctopsyche grandis]|uniref:transmembrane protein 17A n=1 Tax=Arctopsyche grandis TaxID=121162 RepID=UPI00406D8E5A
MNWREAVTDFSTNIFKDLPPKYTSYEIGKYEPCPSMPLQMFLFLNVFMFPFWIVTTIIFLYLKFQCLGHLTQFLSITVFIMIIFIELMRLYLGYTGNLSEKIPELAGFWMLSILLQLPLHTFLLINPYLQQRPVELTLNGVMWLLLLAELFTGFHALREAAARAKRYFALKTHLRATSNKAKVA